MKNDPMIQKHHEMTKDEELRFQSILRGFSRGMLVTLDAAGAMRARPMTIASVDDGGDLQFLARRDSDVVQEITRSPQVLVTFQRKTAWAEVRGVAHVVTDRAVVHGLFRETMRVWYPKGPDDPELCAIHLRSEFGEYWDLRGLEGLKLAFRAADALVNGTALRLRTGQHAAVGDG